MKKKLILFLAVFIAMFATRVYAEDIVGSLDKPDVAEEGVDYEISSNDMFEGEPLADGTKTIYYAWKITIENDYTKFWFNVPTLKNAEDDTILFAFITNVETSWDNLVPIDGRFFELQSFNQFDSVDSFLKPGDYYLMIGFVVSEENYYEYTSSITFYTNDEIRTELEPNNFEEEANELRLDTMFGAYIGDFDFEDYYNVSLSAYKKARVYVSEFDALEEANITFDICNTTNNKCINQISTGEFVYDITRDQYYYEFIPDSTAVYSVGLSGIADKIYYEIAVYQAGTINDSPIEMILYIEENSSESYPPVFRIYNPFNGEHLYTTDSHEVKILFKDYGWGIEGVGWYSSTEGIPVYRLYNPIINNHLYTSDLNEINIITRDYGWIMDNDGKPVMYSTGDEEDVPVYRLYNPYNNMHHLTTDENEYNVLPDYGWQQEGASMYSISDGYAFPTDYYHVEF